MPGRSLINRDVLQVVSAAGERVTVRLLTGRDGAGAETWGQLFSLRREWLAEHAVLAYATTAHGAQGITTDTGHALITGHDDRQSAYSAMTRGRDANYAYIAGDVAGPLEADEPSAAAPEVARARQLEAERAGRMPGLLADVPMEGDAVSVLSQVVSRDGRDVAAIDAQARAWADADSLAVLAPRFADVTGEMRREAYTAAVRDVLPASVADAALADPAVTWLWRSLRAAELAGHDARDLLAEVTAERPMTGARDPARVLDFRVRQAAGGEPARLGQRWADRVPPSADPDASAYARQLAEAMDARVDRLGQHAAADPPGLGSPGTRRRPG